MNVVTKPRHGRRPVPPRQRGRWWWLTGRYAAVAVILGGIAYVLAFVYLARLSSGHRY